MDIENSRKMLMEKIRSREEADASTLFDEEEPVSETFSSKRTVRRALKELANEENLLNREKQGRKWIYSLSEKGKNFLRKIRKRQREKQDDDDIFDYDDGYQEFVRYFESEDWGFNQVKKASVGRNFVYIDHQQLETFNHELADDLLNNPDKVLSAAKEAVRSLPEVEDDVDVRIRNVDEIEQQNINDLSARDRNKLVSVEGVIQSVSRPGSIIVSADFECAQCGERYRKDQDRGGQVKSPYKCECGSRKFETLRENHRTVRYVNIKEKPDQRSRDKIVAVIEGDLAEDENKNLKAIGSGVKIIGYVDTYLKKKNDEFQSFRLVANNIEVESTKWNLEEIDAGREKEIQELAKQEGIERKMVDSLAYKEIKGNKLLKEAFIVFLLGKSSDYGNVHFLCVGDPGTGKSHLGKYVAQQSNRVLKSVATGATEVGLTAAVVKDEMTGEWTAEAGALAMADGGFHITDEVDELEDEHYSAYNEALSDESISLAKAGINTELAADVSEFALGNPSPHYSFDPHTPKIEQIPIDKDDLISRFGIILAVEQDSRTEAKMEKVRHILNRNQSGSFEDKDFIDEDLLFDFIHYAQRINPSMSDEAHEKILEACEELFDESDADRIKIRHAEALASISIAYARMHLSEHVMPRHVESAFSFFRRCYSSIGFEMGKDNFNNVEGVNSSKIQKIKNQVKQLSGKDPADVEEVLEKVDLEPDIAEEVISKLEDKGELFEPQPGKVKAV